MKRWFLLNKSSIRDKVISGWESLISNSTTEERACQTYLQEHSSFFFPQNTFGEQIVVSKLKFGADYESDFINCCNYRSAGFQYQLIEIESPNTPPFTKEGKPSGRLSTAVQQIQNWQLWIKKNTEEAKRIFPSKEFNVGGHPNFRFLIIIGRRDNSDNFLTERNYYADSMNIEIRSFDFLTDVAKTKKFYSFTNITQDMIGPNEKQNNDFTNPFHYSYNSSEWNNIVKSPKLTLSHMVGHNIDLLLSNRRINSHLEDEFDKYLKTLDPKEMDIEQWEKDIVRP